MAKTRLAGNFSFGPEMLTHAHVIDINSGEDLSEYEHRWSQKQNKETLVPYISKAFSILKDAGIDATGVTSPWDFGEQILDDYEEAISLSIKNVYGKNEAWYFLHMLFDTPNARPWLAAQQRWQKISLCPRHNKRFLLADDRYYRYLGGIYQFDRRYIYFGKRQKRKNNRSD